MLPVNLKKKRMLIKDRVGVARTSTYNLPTDPNHVYGYVRKNDEEGCGALISNWVASDPSIGKEHTLNYVHSNILATDHGCVTASAMRLYSIQHPNIRLKEEAPPEDSRVKKNANHEGPFGIKTKFAAEPMHDIVQTKYTNYSTEDADYPDTSNIMKLSSFPKPIATKSSAALIESRRKEKEQAALAHKPFCMKKFQGITSTFQQNIRRDAANAAAAAAAVNPAY